MLLIQTISTKTLDQASVGEFVKLKTPAGNLFAVILDSDAQGTLVGFLETNQRSRYPTFKQVSKGLKCLSYGLNWVVDRVGNDESWAGNRSHLASAGAILVDSHAV
ncbi:hypothetical protein [Bradyrhizobium sp. ORS 86]|uniref:hypothetical protein n=1 Tax=Bradyrhizobium sp. ORS 86 TaxID=1685970 RepID=UPI00388E9C18